MIDTLTRSGWIRTATAAGLVPLLLVTSVPACALRSDTSSMPAQRQPGGLGPRVVSDSQSAARTLSDWSRIEAVPVGTKTEVQLYDDEAPPDSRRVTGRFHAATADTLTLTLEDLTATSSTRTLVKSAVHSVSVRRPIKKRYAGWATLVGGTLGLMLYYTMLPDPLTPVGGFVVGATYAAPASLLGFLLDRRQRIYEVPTEASRPITQVDVPADVVPRGLKVR